MEQQQVKRTQYALESGRVVREKRKVGFNFHAVRASAYEDQSPFDVYHDKFSRIEVVMSDFRDKIGKTCRANIPFRELESIFRRTDYAFKKYMDAEVESTATSQTTASPAYTVRLASGTFKGKTPAEILIEDPTKKEDLINQGKYLKEKLVDYPKNQVQIDAIKDALTLLKNGELNAEMTNKVMPVVNLYAAEARALVRNAREDGMAPVYEVFITWDLGQPANPVTVRTVNYYAPVTKTESGRINPQKSLRDKTSLVEISMNMTSAEWLNIVRGWKANMSQFEMMWTKQMFSEAEKADRENRQAASTK